MPEPVAGVAFAVRDASRPLVVVGPSLGTSVTALWQDVVPLVAGTVDVVGWDLPGHGASARLDGPIEATIPDLAAAVLEVVAQAQRTRGDEGEPWWFAGVSVAGAVGLQLLLDRPHAVAGAALIATGAKIGTAEGWLERAQTVQEAGTPTQVIGSAQRWFAPGFLEASPAVGTRVLASLQTADRFGYAAVCRGLADFDVRDRLGEIEAPVFAVAGEHDPVTTVDTLREIADGVRHGTLRVIPGVSHQVSAEAPQAIAKVVLELVTASGNDRQDQTEVGFATRRAVLGDEHVDAAIAGTTAFTADFQDLITRYAWGEIWSRPGLDRRSRSIATLTALIAGGHWEELAMHVRAAVRNGLTEDEIREVILQSAIYCSVPSANHAFKIANEVLGRED